MTDRRERIAAIARKTMWARTGDGPIYGEAFVGGAYDLADAVLAALADDLLPELPENWWHIDFRKSDGGQEFVNQPAIPEGHVYARLYTSDQDPEDLAATGPTIPAAINDALKGATDE